MTISLKTIIGIILGLTIGYFIWTYLTTDDSPLEQANILLTHNRGNEAKEIFEQLAADPQKPEDLEADFHLAEMYYNQSISDTDPLLFKAIDHYKKAIDLGFIDAMFPLGNIYNYCALWNNAPNKHLAKAIYEELCHSKHASNVIKARANEKLMEINQELQQNTKYQNKITRTEPTIQTLINNQIPVDIQTVRRVEHIPPTRVRNDSQNVHDSGLQKTFLSGYQNLQKMNAFNKLQIPQREIDEHLKNYLKTCTSIDPETKKTAMRAVEHIKKTNQSITNLKGSSEMEVLTNVYNRIYAEDNKKNRENLKEMLIRQLADAMPRNSDGKEAPVCAQGRVARMFSIFDAVDPQFEKMQLKPKWVLKEELATLAGKCRDDILDSMGDGAKRDYETGGETAEQKNNAERITDLIRKEIEKRGLEEYVDKNILKHDELQKELKPLIDAI